MERDLERVHRAQPRNRTVREGACPNCGDLVPRFHHSSDGLAADVYACTSCGCFAYTNQGALLPVVVPAA